MPHRNAEVRMLDHGYVREARSLLYHAYRHDPTFAYLFESERPGFDQRVRATVRELVQQHFAEELPAIGRIEQELPLRQAEEARLANLIGVQQNTITQLSTQVENVDRSLTFLSEKEKQDSRNIGEIQASIWPEPMREACEAAGMPLI